MEFFLSFGLKINFLLPVTLLVTGAVLLYYRKSPQQSETQAWLVAFSILMIVFGLLAALSLSIQSWTILFVYLVSPLLYMPGLLMLGLGIWQLAARDPEKIIGLPNQRKVIPSGWLIVLGCSLLFWACFGLCVWQYMSESDTWP